MNVKAHPSTGARVRHGALSNRQVKWVCLRAGAFCSQAGCAVRIELSQTVYAFTIPVESLQTHSRFEMISTRL